MRVLELFSGTESFSKVARELGHECTTIDNNPKFNPDICMDILDLNPKQFRKGYFDLIWASPPCTTFSIASVGHHWNNHKPKTEECKKGIKILEKTVKLIKYLEPKFWIIENPMCMTRTLEIMKPLPRTTVTYCQYGDSRMKPTDLWNNFGFIGKRCKNGDKCHVSAPRGSRTGTQGLKNATERGKVPRELCLEILKEVENFSVGFANEVSKKDKEVKE